MAAHTHTPQTPPANTRWSVAHYSPITAPRGLNEDSGLKVEEGLMKLREAHVRPDMALASPFHRTSTLHVYQYQHECMYV